MRTLPWLGSVVFLGLVSFPGIVQANPTSGETTRMETSILPSMEEVVVTDQQDPNNLAQISNRINRRVNPPDPDTFKISDIIQTPILDGLLDENGQVNLPLGIRVYDTMGDLSVGFGSDF